MPRTVARGDLLFSVHPDVRPIRTPVNVSNVSFNAPDQDCPFFINVSRSSAGCNGERPVTLTAQFDERSSDERSGDRPTTPSAC